MPINSPKSSLEFVAIDRSYHFNSENFSTSWLSGVVCVCVHRHIFLKHNERPRQGIIPSREIALCQGSLLLSLVVAI